MGGEHDGAAPDANAAGEPPVPLGRLGAVGLLVAHRGHEWLVGVLQVAMSTMLWSRPVHVLERRGVVALALPLEIQTLINVGLITGSHR